MNGCQSVIFFSMFCIASLLILCPGLLGWLWQRRQRRQRRRLRQRWRLRQWRLRQRQRRLRQRQRRLRQRRLRRQRWVRRLRPPLLSKTCSQTRRAMLCRHGRCAVDSAPPPIIGPQGPSAPLGSSTRYSIWAHSPHHPHTHTHHPLLHPAQPRHPLPGRRFPSPARQRTARP
jgi:hypothetical protein